jgi:hypothetical protein
MLRPHRGLRNDVVAGGVISRRTAAPYGLPQPIYPVERNEFGLTRTIFPARKGNARRKAVAHQLVDLASGVAGLVSAGFTLLTTLTPWRKSMAALSWTSLVLSSGT